MFRSIALLLNMIFWMRNRFRNPDKYWEFANSRKWVFIMGCTNSGTSLLHYLLGSHPDIASLPREGQFLTNALPQPDHYEVGRMWTEKIDLFRATEADRGKYDAVRLIHDWANNFDKITASTVLEKTPQNAIRSRWLQSVFKNSYFIAVARDGRAVAEGISRKEGVDIDRGIAHWIKANTIMLDDASFLKNFKLVRYEDLTAKPNEVALGLFKFIGVDPDVYRFDFQQKLHIDNINYKPSVISNFNQKSFDRIPPHVLKEISAKIKPVMKRLGYQV